MNCAIEFHDSRVAGITSPGNALVVHFRPAYVHQSEGRPGFDSGSGWVQDMDVIISDAVLESNFADLPQDLDNASLATDSNVFENLLPLPFEKSGSVRFEAFSLQGECLLIDGNGATVVATGEPRYVEEFSGSS